MTFAFLLVLMLAPGIANASTAAPPDTLRLEDAYRAARDHYPRGREVEIAARIRELRIENLNTHFLPSLSLNGSAVYQSDVPSIDIPVPGVSPPTVKNDQYKFGLRVDQLIYDGGMTAAQRGVEQTAGDLAGQEAEVATYAIRDQVEAAWFGVLLSEAQSGSLSALVADLEARLQQARSLVDRGASTASNAEVLEAELIRARQQRVATESRAEAGREVLGELTGWNLDATEPLSLPVPRPIDAAGSRPEEVLFELNRENLDRQAAIASRRTRPHISSFVDAAVGRPRGLDFFQNDFGPFVSLGVRVGWNIWDWSRAKRDREALSLQADAVSAREDAFHQQIRTAAARTRREIERLESTIEGDADVVALRARISNEARSKLDNGVITATDYLVERNAEQRARLDAEAHRIQLAQARATLATILGEQ